MEDVLYVFEEGREGGLKGTKKRGILLISLEARYYLGANRTLQGEGQRVKPQILLCKYASNFT